MVEQLDINTMLPNQAEPKRQFRWRVEIDGIDSFCAKTFSRPKKDFQETVIDYINEKYFLAGKHEWMPIDIEFYDMISPSQTQKFLDWVRLCADDETGRMGYASLYKKNFVLKLLDGPGNVVEKWRATGAWLKNVDWGSLDFSNSDALTVKGTVRCDKWTLEF